MYSASDTLEMLKIYSNGQNVMTSQGKLPLANFSINAEENMTENPVYQMYKYGFKPLAKDDQDFDGESLGDYIL